MVSLIYVYEEPLLSLEFTHCSTFTNRGGYQYDFLRLFFQNERPILTLGYLFRDLTASILPLSTSVTGMYLCTNAPTSRPSPSYCLLKSTPHRIATN